MDRHPAFKKLVDKYDLSLWYCYVHLIRNCGAKSALSIIIIEMLFCISEEKFNQNIIKWKTEFNELLNDNQSNASKHIELFNNIIGVYELGFADRKRAYAPFECVYFLRSLSHKGNQK